MKLIKIPNRKEHILTPWLSTDEAAAFCGISRETFRRLQSEILPCPATGGNQSNRRYYAPVLTEWWQKVAEHTEPPNRTRKKKEKQ